MCLLFRKTLFLSLVLCFSWHTLLFHIIPQDPLLVLFFWLGAAPIPHPLLIQSRNKWMTVRDKLRQRGKEGEICSCVVEQPICVKGNPPVVQRELHLLCYGALEAFSCCDGIMPLSSPTHPHCDVPQGSNPFHCFPFVTHLSSNLCENSFTTSWKNTPKMFVQLYSKWTVKKSPAWCGKTAFWPWRIAMVTTPPAVQRALRTKLSQAVFVSTHQISLVNTF